ncbi:DNA gyrase inhibitor YacG [Ancylobacter pratisalsi]|uniref:DNA gyrase inhibitor YacG n=1 Tax=Ancylobacter pratisalsi TaxID=1745854 RepID=A0A6P1YN03_9HYPH|nr:DNA gyrase inhibitor YacG [Ancylobacter pratisalsi]QIB34515.1 DNA gyrase inhibitor YacG [Ancylobacter pratisalsi]
MTSDTPDDPGRDGPARQVCPICGKAAAEKYRPFCSSRCADVDLNRWLTGAYAIPVTEDDDEDGEEPTLSPAPPSER